MRIPINDLTRAIAEDRPAIDRALASVLDGGWLVHGSNHTAFEFEFARYLGTEQVVAVGNGTDALVIALRALGVGPGDRVCTVANAGFYTSTACLQLGAVPVYVDVEPVRLGMDPSALTEALRHSPRAVVITHLYGGMADVEALAEICREHDVPLVEDCAQSTGARTPAGRVAGAIGTLGTFSFYPTKNLAAIGDGGAIATSDVNLAERCRELRQYGWRDRYAVEHAGFNSRLDELQAAVLRERLRRLDERNARRREICRTYGEAVAGQSTMQSAAWDGPDHVGHLAVVRSPHRARLMAHLEAASVGTAIHYPIPDHRQPLWDDEGLSWIGDELTESRRATSEVLSVPCFPELTESEVEHVAAALSAFS